MTTYTIDPSGDVTLVVNNPNAPFAPLPETTAAPPQAPAYASQFTTEQKTNSEVCIKVSGKHLMMASPVFERALTGNWKESLDFKEDGAVKIHAEGWDIEALLVLMRMIHCKAHALPAQASVELIAKLGVLGDYYECIPLVRCYAMNWITPSAMVLTVSAGDDTYVRDLMVRLWISWIFDQPEKFKIYCEMLMQGSRGTMGPFGLPMPADIIDSLNTCRAAAIMAAIHFINDQYQDILTDESHCTVACRSMTLGRLLIFLDKQQILDTKAPYSGVMFSELLSSIRSTKSPAWGEFQSNNRPPREEHECLQSSFDDMFRPLEEGCAWYFDLSDFKP